MFKLSIIGTLCLVSLASAQVLENSRFLAGNNTRQGVPKQYKDTDTINFAATLGCGACIRGGYIFCIPGAEGSDPATWPSGVKNRCYQTAATLAAAALPSPWTCSNTYSDPTLAKQFCPFQGSKCGNIQSFDFAEVGEKSSINLNLNPGETCTYKIRTFKGVPSFTPSDTTGFEIENVDYDDDDLQGSSRRMLGGGKGSNKTADERKKDGFKAESDSPKPRKNITIPRNGSALNGTNPNKGPKVAKFDPSTETKKKFKGGALNKSEPLEKTRYQQISITALGNLTTSSGRILQADDTYTMTLEIGSEDFSGAFGLFFQASVLIISFISFF